MSDTVEYFEYLDALRDSGITNMFGAGVYLSREFGLEKKMAQDVLVRWMETFDPDKPARERARG